MPRKAPPRRGGGKSVSLGKLAEEANQLGSAAREAAEAAELARRTPRNWWDDRPVARMTTESRPTPTVGFGHDPSVGARPRKARKAAAATAARQNKKSRGAKSRQ